MNKTSDPNTYRKMSEPHLSKEDLDKDLKKFWDGVRLLREECGLMDVVCIVQSPYLLGDQIERLGIAIQTHGDRTQAAAMCAQAYGTLRYELEELFDQMIRGKK